MTSLFGFIDKDRSSDDPFESILSTARGIGFQIPEPSRNSEDVQRTSLLENIDQLLEANSQLPVLQSALTALQYDENLDGFLNAETLQQHTQKLSTTVGILEQFQEKRTYIMEKLMAENNQKGIAVELDCQLDFKNLMEAIAKDKYKLMELISRLKELENWKESPMTWRQGLEELRHMQQSLKASNQALNKLKRDIEKHL
eukprot:g5440.t1